MSSIAAEDALPSPQRRIRHIRSIKIRNLTPFPARDALAHNLTHPGSSAAPIQPVDDIELTMARRRRRRSSGSVASIFSNNESVEVEGNSLSPGSKKLVRSGSRGSFQRGMPGSVPRSRMRTNSRPTALQVSHTVNNDTERPVTPLSALFVTHSQRALEDIVSSRLVETFITLTPLAPTNDEAEPQDRSSRPASPAPIHLAQKGKDSQVKRAISATAVTHRRGISTPTVNSVPATSANRMNRSQSFIRPASPVLSRKGLSSTGGSRSRPSSTTVSNFPSPPPTPPPGPSKEMKSHPSPTSHYHDDTLDIPSPFYISPIHTPSINPAFEYLDPEREFAPWADVTNSRLKVSVWGRMVKRTPRPHSASDIKGKGKEMVPDLTRKLDEDVPEWRILDEWIIDLDDMKPFSSEKPGQLPSNTLVLTLSSGDAFQISPLSARKSEVPKANPTVAPGYSSEGEVDDRRQREGELRKTEAEKQEQEVLAKSRRETRMKKSATWQDLVKLVNLQTAIVDTRELLDKVVRNCDTLLEEDGYMASLRECSERDEWVTSLRQERDKVLQHCEKARGDLEGRRRSLEERRRNLKAAHALLDSKMEERNRTVETITEERARHTSLKSSLPSYRTTLIQEVTYIFPIEPLSAPDLLFTILGVPLPIPAGTSDPAPPPSLANFTDVTEDNTATALGYVAQVLQLISVYLGTTLVYPVTCCGSRSIIKDPISAMMGPRTFPLYSKGAETYRYEYGVFLLNKNIEMLMSERNLRAMDIRHTLPNLKNLLLTMTTGEESKSLFVKIPQPKPSQIMSPIRAISPLALDAQAQSSEEPASLSPPAPAPRKSTPFLSPLAGFLRARYPSSIVRPSVKVVDEVPEPAVEEEPSNSPPLASSPTASESFTDDTPLPTTEEQSGEQKVTVEVNANDPLKTPTPRANGNTFEKFLSQTKRSPDTPTTASISS